MYLALLRHSLTERPQDFEASPTDRRPRMWAGLYESGYEEGVVTFMAHTDGSRSVYLSRGGGAIGMQSNEEVAEVGAKFLDALERDLDLLYGVESVPPPPVPMAIRFSAMRFDGLRTATIDRTSTRRSGTRCSR